MEKELPSVGHLVKQLAAFDTEVIDLLEVSLIKDANDLLGKKRFFVALLDKLQVFARKNLATERFVQETIHFVAIPVVILGEFPALRPEQVERIQRDAQRFKPRNLTPLKQAKAVAVYLRERFSSLSFGAKLVLCYVINMNETIRDSYMRLFLFYQRLYGYHEPLLALVPDLPASLTEQSVQLVKEKEVSFFPLPKEHDLLHLDRNHAENVFKNIHLGKIVFRPHTGAGWFEYKNYAYLALAQSKDLAEDAERAVLKQIYLQYTMNTFTETNAADQYALPNFYHRLAQAYAYLLDLIEEVFASEARNFIRENQTNHLITELKNMIRTFYGLSLLSEQKLGIKKQEKDHDAHLPITVMKSMYNLKTDTFSKICADNPEKCLQASLQWELFLP